MSAPAKTPNGQAHPVVADDGEILTQAIEQTDRTLNLVGNETLAAIVGAEIDMQISTAKRYPRSYTKFRDRAISMACCDEEIAGSCFYTLPRGGKSITGPSIRLAEIVAACWQNIRVNTRIVSETDRFITAQATCHDMENNVAATVEVQRRITNKNGRKFNDDMIQMTGNAASSIARRNAIFAVVPYSYVREVEKRARETSIGKAETLVVKRDKMVKHFASMGVKPEQLCRAVEKHGIEDIGLEELLTLRGIATALKDGVTTIEQSFPANERQPGEDG